MKHAVNKLFHKSGGFSAALVDLAPGITLFGKTSPAMQGGFMSWVCCICEPEGEHRMHNHPQNILERT